MDMEQKFDENLLNLIELYCRKGHLSPAQFGGNTQRMESFVQENGISGLAFHYHRAAERYGAAVSPEATLQAKADMNKAAAQIRERVREIILQKSGINLEEIYGKEPTREEARRMLYDQFEQMGMDEKTIRTLGLDDIEKLLEEGAGREFSYAVDDTEAARRTFEREKVEYEARDGKLHAKARVHVAEGVAVDDTPQNRKLLDEHEIDYISMAMNINPGQYKMKLMVPNTWFRPLRDEVKNEMHAVMPKLLNNAYMKNYVAILATIGTSYAFGISPLVMFAAYLVLRKTGVLDTPKVREAAPTLFEKKALKEGHTVYKEQKKDGQAKSQYLFMHEGNLIRINASDVRIPEYIKGIRMTAGQRDAFRKGELVELRDRQGQELLVRIDLAKPSMYREYYRQMKSDRDVMQVPDGKSRDIDKLEYISRKGMAGIRDIYGPKRPNIFCETFLNHYGLKTAFNEYLTAVDKYKQTEDSALKEKYRQEFKKADQSIKDIAGNEVISQHKSNSRGR